MVTTRGAWRRWGPEGQDGSALVLAVMLGAVLLVLGGGLVVRTAGALAAAQGVEDRARARVVAERELEVAVRGMASGALLDGLLQRIPSTSVREVADGVTVRIDPGDGPDESRIVVEVRVGDAVHTSVARVRPFLSADHLLLLEHRVVDPAILRMPRASCLWPADDPRRATGCLDVGLGPQVLDGPVHVEEGLLLPADTAMTSIVTTGLLITGEDGVVRAMAVDDGATSGAERTAPAHRAGLALPRAIAGVRGAASVTCRFRGPTSLRFDGPGVRVRSPLSVPRDGDEGSAIGCMGVDRTLLAGITPIVLPSDAVIEVVRDPDAACAVHPLGLGADDADRAWACDAGSALVWGRYEGRRTVLAEDDIQIVWDVEPGDAAGAAPLDRGDLLGLVAGDSIVLRRPVGRPIRRIAPLGQNIPFAGPDIPPFGAFPLDAPSATPVTWERPRIVAALAALQGSVTLQNPFLGQPHTGPVLIHGSVAARFPGLFTWEERTSTGALIGTTGYGLDLRHDLRLLADAPPLLPITDTTRVRIIHRDLG